MMTVRISSIVNLTIIPVEIPVQNGLAGSMRMEPHLTTGKVIIARYRIMEKGCKDIHIKLSIGVGRLRYDLQSRVQ